MYTLLTMSRSDKVSVPPRLERYRAATHLPLLVLALAIIPLLVLPLTVDVSPAIEDAFLAADLSIWALFALDLCIRAYLSGNRVDYLKTHWLDVLIVVLPFLRLLKVIEFEWVLRLLRAEHGMEKAKENFRAMRRR
ncbi:MAG: hypothetical protein ACRDFW_10200 [bacterium]